MSEPAPRPVQQTLIVARKTGTGDTISTQTEANGSYTLTLPVGISVWELRAATTTNTTPGGVIAPPGVQMVSFGRQPESRIVDWRYAMPDAQLAGQVLVAGTPPIVPSVPVTVTAVQLSALGDLPGPDLSAPVRMAQAINSDGTFTLTVPAGLYVVTVGVAGITYLPPAPMQASVAAGETRQLGILYLTPIGNGAVLRGRVATLADEGAPGLQVVAYNLDTSQLWPSRSTTTEGPQGSFTLTVTAGTWWVAVILGGTDYMPEGLQWQTRVSVQAGDVVDTLVLRVVPADMHIQGALVQEANGAPASDACGLVAAYKEGDPSVYDYRRFSGGFFDLPVVSGTYRLVILPNPGLEQLAPIMPPDCAIGKYLTKTVREVVVGPGATVPLTVPLKVASATIQGQLWNSQTQAPLSGWEGQILGWSQGTWSAMRVNTATGIGELPAGPGDWWLAYHVAPQSGYEARPGMARAQVPADADDVTVNLPVVASAALITGTVLGPDGTPLPWIVMTAMQLSAPTGGGARAVTDREGRFALTVDYGQYLVSAFAPPVPQLESNWVSPPPTKVTLTFDHPMAQLELRYQTGDATLHGRLDLAPVARGASGLQPVPAFVWATSLAGHSKTWVPMPMDVDQEYRLPALQGQTWLVGAAYEIDNRLWVTGTVVMVASANVRQDLYLSRPYTLATNLVEAVSAAQPFYGELADGASAYIPAGALPTAAATGTELADQPQPWHNLVRFINTGQVLMTLGYCSDWWDVFYMLYPDGIGTWALESRPAAPVPSDLVLLTPSYTLSAEDAQGNALVGLFDMPAVVRIPFSLQRLAERGFTAENIQPVCIGADGALWGSVGDYVVDAAAQEVVIFAARLGGYALIATRGQYSLAVPLIAKRQPGP